MKNEFCCFRKRVFSFVIPDFCSPEHLWLGENPVGFKLSFCFRVFPHFISLALLLDILPTTSHLHISYFRSLIWSTLFCQFHAGPVLGESPRGLERWTSLYLPLFKPDFFIINHLFCYWLQFKKSWMEIIFRYGSHFLFCISQFKIIYLNTALCKCVFQGLQLFSTWATVKSYWH